MSKKWRHESVKRLIEENKETGVSDPIEIVQNLTRSMVLDAFTNGWEGPPYDIVELARIHNIEVTPNELVQDARIIPKPKSTFSIEYNPFQKPSRINFSLAHEIGHTLFSDCAETIRYRSKVHNLENSSWELEFLCNIAAAEILLPYAKFSQDANEVPLTMDSLKLLANKYGASIESLFIRFCEVLNKPCSAMIANFDSKGNLVTKYTVKSDSSNLYLKDGFVIPKNSIAYECIKPGWTSHELEEWDEFGNTRYMVYAIGLPSVRKHIESRVGLFIVPEFYAESKNAGLYMVNGDATEPRSKKGNKIIAQVVNMSAGTGRGFGKSMAVKYPSSKKALTEWKNSKDNFELGESQLIPLNEDTFVFHMLAQKGLFPKNGVVPLKYGALHECLIELREQANYHNASVHMPMIGAGNAGGDWEIISGMIYQELVRKNINVAVYVWPGSRPPKPKTIAPNLFHQIN